MEEMMEMMKMVLDWKRSMEAREQASGSHQNEAERPVGSEGDAVNQAPRSVLFAVDETASSPTTDLRSSVVSNGKPGKLDTTTLLRFPECGKDDLSYAEQWIAKAEKLATRLNLDDDLLCMAFYQRAVGEVKKCLDSYGDDSRQDWASLRTILLGNFSKEKYLRKFEQELAIMDKVAGLPLGVAVDRVRRLIAAADHPPTKLGPIRLLVERFPRDLTFLLGDRLDQWKSCQEALDDLMKIAWNDMKKENGPFLVAVPPSKNSAPVPKAGLVAVAEPEDPAAMVATVVRNKEGKKTVRCYYCDQTGHIMRGCPVLAEKIAKAKESKN
jgi:hypothetical protein